MDLIEKICDPVIVMAEGSVLFEGKFAEVKSNEEVIEAYLGRGLKVKIMISLVGNNLTAGYGGVDIIKNITLKVKQGEIAVIVGPNGAGKTTLISIICGIVTPSSGTVTVDGFDIIKDYRETRSRIGMVPQRAKFRIF